MRAPGAGCVSARRALHAGRCRFAGTARAAPADQRAFWQRKINVAAGVFWHLAVCAGQGGAAAGCHVHSPAPVLPEWQSARCPGLSRAGRALWRRAAQADPERCAIAAAAGAAR